MRGRDGYVPLRGESLTEKVMEMTGGEMGTVRTGASHSCAQMVSVTLPSLPAREMISPADVRGKAQGKGERTAD